MRKTIQEWGKTLPEPYRTQFADNLGENSAYAQADSLVHALYGAFEWDASPQGHKYWQDLTDSLIYEEE